MKILFLIVITGFVFSGCSSTPTNSTYAGRVYIDSTTHRDGDTPSWVSETKTKWESGDKVYIKASHTIMGSERLSGCYDLAILDGKEKVMREASEEVRGTITNAEESLSESSENLLGKVREGKWEGTIKNMNETDRFFIRYLANNVERIDCDVLFQMTKTDYDRVKLGIAQAVERIDPKLKAALIQKHVDFIGVRNPSSNNKVSQDNEQ